MEVSLTLSCVSLIELGLTTGPNSKGNSLVCKSSKEYRCMCTLVSVTVLKAFVFPLQPVSFS